MGEWIIWCSCGGRILTTQQMREHKKCQLCQDKEHAKSLKERVLGEERKDEMDK